MLKERTKKSPSCKTLTCTASISVWFWSKERREKDKERDSRFWPREKWNKSSLTRPIFRAVFVSRSIFHAAKTESLVPRSLLRNRTETLDTQANKTSLNVMGPWFYWGIATIKEQENLGLKRKESTT